MKYAKTFLGIALLLAASTLGLGAANASASTNFTCLGVNPGDGTFSDNHCETSFMGGSFRTDEVPVGTSTTLEETNTGNSIFGGTLSGIKFEVSCEGFAGTSVETNVKTEKGVMQVEGKEIVFQYSTCTVLKPAGKGCVISEPIKTKTLVAISEESGGTKFKYSPASGTEIGSLTLSGCSVSALNNTFPMTGTITALVNGSKPATLEFTSTSSALKIAGQAGTYFGTVHRKMAGTTNTVAFE